MGESLVYELDTKFEYAHKGQAQEASFIELRAPTTKNLKECAFLKQAVFKTLTAAGKDGKITEEDKEKAKDSKDESFTGPEVMLLLSGSTEVDLAAVLATARALFTSKSGVALVEGEERLTGPLADLMSLEDLEAMTGEYLANFILASSLKSMSNL